MMFNSGVEKETINIFEELLNQAHRELYLECLELSSLNFLVMLMHVKEFTDLAHCPTCGESRYKASPIRGKNLAQGIVALFIDIEMTEIVCIARGLVRNEMAPG
ncbi:uncharacterized protein E5676_scaffold184G00290 [Cucumis melo var. makuwa]|uniref:Uncharacterized protein n=1 Tax=Cucumis melo var. makuwa TaxID=1194695 RepID=A0A5A7UX99_CUCMM|nr:uncharacterized protein E6C27_scaffold108G001040 [Cucumis melo var. makuwa]TYK24787.1 uncharacterized protein E5676_scaffold184G00290 [Cucumis melo var. makuwa]